MLRDLQPVAHADKQLADTRREPRRHRDLSDASVCERDQWRRPTPRKVRAALQQMRYACWPKRTAGRAARLTKAGTGDSYTHPASATARTAASHDKASADADTPGDGPGVAPRVGPNGKAVGDGCPRVHAVQRVVVIARPVQG